MGIAEKSPPEVSSLDDWQEQVSYGIGRVWRIFRPSAEDAEAKIRKLASEIGRSVADLGVVERCGNGQPIVQENERWGQTPALGGGSGKRTTLVYDNVGAFLARQNMKYLPGNRRREDADKYSWFACAFNNDGDPMRLNWGCKSGESRSNCFSKRLHFLDVDDLREGPGIDLHDTRVGDVLLSESHVAHLMRRSILRNLRALRKSFIDLVRKKGVQVE